MRINKNCRDHECAAKADTERIGGAAAPGACDGYDSASARVRFETLSRLTRRTSLIVRGVRLALRPRTRSSGARPLPARPGEQQRIHGELTEQWST